MVASPSPIFRAADPEAEAGFAHCYRTKILFAVGGFMGLSDLRPLPIPLLVRYRLIDSCSLAAGMRSHGYYHVVRANGLETNEKGRKRGKNETRKDTREKKNRKVEVAAAVLYLVCYRAGTKLNLCPRSWHSLVLRTCHAAAPRAKSMNVSIH